MYFKIHPILISESMYKLGIGTPFICVVMSKNVDKGISKVPLSPEIGVRVQVSTSKIYNLPCIRTVKQNTQNLAQKTESDKTYAKFVLFMN